jgi:hypothetical protein
MARAIGAPWKKRQWSGCAPLAFALAVFQWWSRMVCAIGAPLNFG